MTAAWPTSHGDTVTVYSGADGQWYFHVKAANGEVVEQGEGYERRIDAVTAAERHHPPEGSQR